MAAAPAAVPAPLPTHVLPPAKRENRDPGCSEISPVFPATAAAGWSSLPDDLVRRIADSFLATNDLDHYMYFRAVCPSWRAATDDPRNDNPLFNPCWWIVLDEVFQRDDDELELLLLNVATGRFLRRKLPLLRDYYVVATTPGGLFLLADRSPPHAARVFNPLTGVLTRFAAPVPPEVTVANIGIGTRCGSLAILLLADSSNQIHIAVADNKAFTTQNYPQGTHNLFRNGILGSAHRHLNGAAWSGVLADLCNFLGSHDFDTSKFFFAGLPETTNEVRCSLVTLGEHMLLFLRRYDGSFVSRVWKMDSEIGELVPVRNLGRYSIFIGHRRCLCVDTHKFPGIEANCVYYTQHVLSSAYICKWDIKDYKVEMISENSEFRKQGKQFVLVADRPFTIIQLLCSYTINTPDSQLALQQMLSEESPSNFEHSDLND